MNMSRLLGARRIGRTARLGQRTKGTAGWPAVPGFTLIELLVVIAIIAMLTLGFATPRNVDSFWITEHASFPN
jgi:prepilin-type N-terminal cleavage/methylation domain-containing protein